MLNRAIATNLVTNHTGYLGPGGCRSLTIDQYFNVQVLSGNLGGCRTSERWLWPFELTLGIGRSPGRLETDGSDRITDLG